VLLLTSLALVTFDGLLATTPLRAEEPPLRDPEVEAIIAEQANPRSAEEEQEYYDLLQLFVDTLDQVERNYVQKVSRREMMEAAILGLLSKLDDHSNYIAPDELDQFRKGVENEFGGVGIQIGMESDRLIVISPLVGTPAYRSGIMAGDRIVRIADEITDGMTLKDAVDRLQGKLGTSVTMTVVHRNQREPQTVTLRRERIRVETVLGDHRKEDDSWQFLYDTEYRIGYVRITAFSNHTASSLREALDELTQQGMRALVLDLRFNPGGLLSAAVQVSDLFLSEGRIVTTEGRNIEGESWDATKDGTYLGFLMAVLVNRYSASASEIVAACLQDHGRAVVVGERTFGKASVQQVVDLEHGRSALKLTTGSYQRPSGKNIQRFEDAGADGDWGVRPNDGLDVAIGGREMVRLFGHRQERDIVESHQPPTDAVDTDEDPDPEDQGNETAPPAGESNEPTPEFTDRQLEKALEYLRAKLAENEKD
jgi:carboxyl-terminal processing protease